MALRVAVQQQQQQLSPKECAINLNEDHIRSRTTKLPLIFSLHFRQCVRLLLQSCLYCTRADPRAALLTRCNTFFFITLFNEINFVFTKIFKKYIKLYPFGKKTTRPLLLNLYILFQMSCIYRIFYNVLPPHIRWLLSIATNVARAILPPHHYTTLCVLLFYIRVRQMFNNGPPHTLELPPH